MFGKRICTVAWTLTGLCAVVLYKGLTEGEQIDRVYGMMAYDLLPKVAPGLIGLFMACMLASVMSSCDAFMVAASGLLTENIYKKVVGSSKPEKHYVLVGRVGSLVVVALGIYCAMEMESVVKGLEVFWKIAAMMGVAFWVGLFWRRATAAGAWAATLASFAVMLFSSRIAFGSKVLWDFDATYASRLPEFMLYGGKLLLSWQMVMYLVVGFVTLVAVSLITKRRPQGELDRMYACLRTPVGPNEPEVKAFTLPDGVESARREVLIDHPDFEIPRLTLTGLAGFVGSWLIVGILIWSVYWFIGN